MLVVKIELHSAVTGEIKTVATGTICNTGTGSPTQGNYRIDLRDAAGRLWKRGYIEGFPRKRLLAWDLMYRGLRKLVGNRNPTLDSAGDAAYQREGKATTNHKSTDP